MWVRRVCNNACTLTQFEFTQFSALNKWDCVGIAQKKGGNQLRHLWTRYRRRQKEIVLYKCDVWHWKIDEVLCTVSFLFISALSRERKEVEKFQFQSGVSCPRSSFFSFVSFPRFFANGFYVNHRLDDSRAEQKLKKKNSQQVVMSWHEKKHKTVMIVKEIFPPKITQLSLIQF